jgi:hypothetical protein
MASFGSGSARTSNTTNFTSRVGHPSARSDRLLVAPEPRAKAEVSPQVDQLSTNDSQPSTICSPLSYSLTTSICSSSTSTSEATERHAYQVVLISAAILMPCSKKPRMIAARV